MKKESRHRVDGSKIGFRLCFLLTLLLFISCGDTIDTDADKIALIECEMAEMTMPSVSGNQNDKTSSEASKNL